MMAVSQPEGDRLVDLLLKKGADVSCKSDWSHFPLEHTRHILISHDLRSERPSQSFLSFSHGFPSSD